MLLFKLLSFFRQNRPGIKPTVTSIPTVVFDSRWVTASVRADILSTLKGAKDIPRAKLPAIGKIAVPSVERGRDLGMLHSAIMSSGIEGMTKWRASEITMHVHNRATSIIDVQRQGNIGIREAVWLCSGAPCYPNVKSPTPDQVALDAAHKAANNQRYRVAEGLTIAGKRTWPGREMGCKCLSRPVVEGFS